MLRYGVVTSSPPFAYSTVPHNTLPPPMSHRETLHSPYLLPKGKGESWYWRLVLQLGSSPHPFRGHYRSCSLLSIWGHEPHCSIMSWDRQKVRKDDRKTVFWGTDAAKVGLENFDIKIGMKTWNVSCHNLYNRGENQPTDSTETLAESTTTSRSKIWIWMECCTTYL